MRFLPNWIKWIALRMDYTQPGFWIAISVGGTLIGSLTAAQQFMNKEKPFDMRPVVRDFCFGAFLTAILYMFLPESMQSWVLAGQGALSKMTPLTQNQDIELQLGPARF